MHADRPKFLTVELGRPGRHSIPSASAWRDIVTNQLGIQTTAQDGRRHGKNLTLVQENTVIWELPWEIPPRKPTRGVGRLSPLHQHKRAVRRSVEGYFQVVVPRTAFH